MQKAKKFLPVIGKNKKVKISIENDEVVIRLLTWTDFLGWQCQKTIAVEAEMLPELQRALIAAERQIRNQKNFAQEPNGAVETNIVRFPSLNEENSD